LVLSWAGMLSDLGLGILLPLNRWPRLTFVWLCLFNGLNIFFFGWGIQTFPYLMVSSYVLFLPASTVRQLAAGLIEGTFAKNRVEPRGI